MVVRWVIGLMLLAQVCLAGSYSTYRLGTIYNTSAGTVWYTIQENLGGTWYNKGSWSIASGGSQAHGLNLGGVDFRVIYYSNSGYSEQCYIDTLTYSAGDPEVNLTFSSCAGAAPVYYASGCITNHTSYVARYWFFTSSEYTQESPPVPPGDYWCVNYTNSSPFQYWMDRVLYDSDGGTNWFNTYPPTWANTNTPPGSPSGHTDNESERDPASGVDGNTGYGQTNGLTGDQYTRGVSNIIDAIYGAQQQNNQGFANVGRLLSSTTNTPGTNDLSGLVPWLSAISNRTDAATGHLAKASGVLGYVSNLINSVMTNVPTYSNTYAVASNNAFSVSNTMVAVGATSLVSSAQTSTNLASAVSDSSIWDVTVVTNTSMVPGVFTFNPIKTGPIRAFIPWIRLIIMFVIVWMCWGYMYQRISETSLGLYHIPGAGPGSGNMVIGSWWSLTYSPLILASMLAIFPILLAVGLQTISMFFGGVIISPLSESGIALLSGAFGDYTPHVRAGLDVLFTVVPVGFIMSVFVYMIVFELLVFGAAHFASFMIKTISN